MRESVCPGCGLRMPASDRAVYEGYFNASPECWSVFTEVVGAEFGNAVLFGQVHQLSVDTYAVQHTGGRHPAKSVAVHLASLHLILELGHAPPSVPPLLRRLVESVEDWPSFSPPAMIKAPTVCDVALADSADGHIEAVRGWAGTVWAAWSPHHDEVAGFVANHLSLE